MVPTRAKSRGVVTDERVYFRHRYRSTPDLDVALLLKLATANSVFHALSVENIMLLDKREAQALVKFGEALDALPRIDCLYLGGNFFFRGWELKVFLLTITGEVTAANRQQQVHNPGDQACMQLYAI
ncbi:hypothetical protein CPC16_000193 [Podila verticillata]|nr:hypothetical protein CPC16_000193 [Podila verticillata]